MTNAQVTKARSTDRLLTGQVNWERWYSGFKADARADDTWSLFDKSEAIVEKPTRTDYTFCHISSESTSDSKDTAIEVARKYFAYKQSLEWYKMDLHDYEQQHERVRRASKMILDRIDPSMLAEIEEDIQDPAVALEHLRAHYAMQD